MNESVSLSLSEACLLTLTITHINKQSWVVNRNEKIGMDDRFEWVKYPWPTGYTRNTNDAAATWEEWKNMNKGLLYWDWELVDILFYNY